MNKVYFALLYWLCAVCVGCSDGPARYVLPTEPDYAQESAWYKEANAVDGGLQADVFYVAPTCVWDWQDAQGRVMHFEDVYNEDQRRALRPSLELAADIFADSYNFYAPYYRQITLESWMEGEDTVEKRFPYAMADVKRAFDYYLEHENGGRPFILAGFSQGAKAVVELLKDMPSGVYEQLVAAYVIGYNVSEREAEYFKTIEAARDSVDTGVTVCYNSVDSVDAICPVLSDSYLCINPVNWKTDGSPAYLNDSVTVRIDTKHHVLLVDGFDEKQYYLPSLGAMFKEGNYHLQELTFYQDCLNRNVKQRVRSYYRQPHKRGF